MWFLVVLSLSSVSECLSVGAALRGNWEYRVFFMIWVINFFPLKLLVAIQVVHTPRKCDTECTVAEAKYFGGFFGHYYYYCYYLVFW